MRADGKPAKVAIIAVARKLLVLANSLVKNDSLYDPNRSDSTSSIDKPIQSPGPPLRGVPE
jgi:hypothetical protein